MIVLPIMIGFSSIEYESSFFAGKNTDFGATWYNDIGYQIVFVMIIFAF